jgi:hypothetical protein
LAEFREASHKVRLLRLVLFTQKYDPLIDWFNPSHAKYFGYGTDPHLDAQAKGTIGMMSQDVQDKVNDLRQFLDGKAEGLPGQ